MSGRRPYALDELLRLWDSGLTQKQVASRLGVSERTVQRALRAAGAPKSQLYYPGLTEAQHEVIRARLDEGWSYAEIARTYGHGRHVLAKHYPGRGWTREQRGRYGNMRRAEAARKARRSA